MSVVRFLSGGRFDVRAALAGDPVDVDLHELAIHIAWLPRYNGGSRRYTVGMHCLAVGHVLADWIAPTASDADLGDLPTHDRHTIAGGLLHDFCEAVIGDMVRPIKDMPEMRWFRDTLEPCVQRAIERAAGLELDADQRSLIARADMAAFSTEIDTLEPRPADPSAWKGGGSSNLNAKLLIREAKSWSPREVADDLMTLLKACGCRLSCAAREA